MKRKIFSIVFALALVLGFILATAVPAGANGVNYYVATTGSDDFGNGTENWVDNDSSSDWSSGDTGPWLTIQYAIGECAGGETINVAAGTYNEALDLRSMPLTIDGAGVEATIVDAHLLTGYAVKNFGNSSTIKNLKLIGTSDYGFKVSGVSVITLQNIRVENSGKTGVDLNGVNGATLDGITVLNTTNGFGVMICDSNNVVVNNVATNNNAWGGVTIQTKGEHYPGGSHLITFSGNFNALENNPLQLENDPDPDNGTYYDISNVTIPGKFTHVDYAFRAPDNYKQWFYQETLDGAKALAQALMGSPYTYSGMLIYDIAGANYYVIEGMKIQDAVDDASGTVNVGAGTYSEGQIVISTDISIVGDPLAKPVINPTGNLTGNNPAGAWFLVNSGVSFDLSNVVLDGSTFWVHQAIRNHGNATIDNVDFRNIQGSLSGSPYRGIAISSYGGTVAGGAGSDSHGGGGGSPSHLVVSDSTFEQIGRIGVLVKGTEATAEITGCTYTGKGDGDWLDYALEAGAGGSVTINDNHISGNVGVASVDGSTSAGILVTTYYGAGTEATITGNTLTGNTEGIAVGYDGSDTSTVVAHFNNISGNTLDGIATTAPAVDAEDNWWDSANGPDPCRQYLQCRQSG